MKGIVKDLLVGNLKSHGVGQWLTGTEVAGIAWVFCASADGQFMRCRSSINTSAMSTVNKPIRGNSISRIT
jgi:hypothetical protein